MKNRITKIIILTLTVAMLLTVLPMALTSCEDGVTVTGSYVNDDMHAIVKFSDGSEKDLGYVGVVDESKNVRVKEIRVNEEDLHVVVEYTDGTKADLGYVGVNDESLNVKVKSTWVDVDTLHAFVEYTDGTKNDLGYVGYADESLNVKVKRSWVDEGTLHAFVEYTDGTQADLGYVGYVDESLNVKVKRSWVDEDTLHAFVEYTDGKTEDLGYVGVDVVPPVCKVTFVDADGKVLSEQEVYRGLSAKAPTPPEIPDHPFDRWDADYTSIPSDLVIHPIYLEPTIHIVTFEDGAGNVLKTEEVITGHDAHAPSVPDRDDEVFDEWDQSYTHVTSDLTVIAQYRQKRDCTVTFKDYSGRVFGTATVKEGGTATAPVTPSRSGYSFTGWSSSLSGITSDKTVTAQYSFDGGTNVADISYSLGSGNTFTVTVTMRGSVKFCGLEGSMSIPSGVTYQSVSAGSGDTTVNYSGGSIFFMFSSGTGKNVTSTTTLFTATFSYSSGMSSASFGFSLSDIYDQDFNGVGSSDVGSTVYFD